MGQHETADSADRDENAAELQMPRTMRHFAAGTCVVTTYRQGEDGRREVVTADSVTSLALEPPLVWLSFRGTSDFLGDLMKSRVWGISILDTENPQDAQENDNVDWMVCRYRDHLPAGEQIMVVGEITVSGQHELHTPLPVPNAVRRTDEERQDERDRQNRQDRQDSQPRDERPQTQRV